MEDIVLLAGGLGGAHLASALAGAGGAGRLTVVVNVGDDLDWPGLRVCPDLDTVLCSLTGRLDRQRGWGRTGETFVALAALEQVGEPVWFGVGDQDLAAHVLRTERLRAGRSLTEATAELAVRLGADEPRVLPAADVPCRTRLELADGRSMGFQEWYVRLGATAPVRAVNAGRGPASSDALDALSRASTVVLGPSNPVSSVGTILTLDGVVEAMAHADRVVAESPTVGTAPLAGTVAHHALARRQLLAASGDGDSAAGIARHYSHRFPGLVDTFVLDVGDADQADVVASTGLQPVLAPLLDPHALAMEVMRTLTGGAPALPSPTGARLGGSMGGRHRVRVDRTYDTAAVATASTAPKVARFSDGSPLGSGHAGGGGRPGRTVQTSAPLGGHHIADDDG